MISAIFSVLRSKIALSKALVPESKSNHPGSATDRSPLETGSAKLKSEGTHWNYGTHACSLAMAQKSVSKRFTAGSLPYPFCKAANPELLSMKEIQ